MTDMALGDALGQEYVRIAFSPDAKQKVLAMINNLKDALRDRISQLDWMSPSTKQQANEKLNTLMVKIGYPDKWKDYNGLNIDRGAYVLNVMRSDSFEYNRNIHKLGKAVDRTEWEMTPPTINAYYNPAMNEIVFPAGILQAPFFDPKADDALNYGGIGAVIGHELTHGYDDEGRLYDAKGNLKNWWTKEDSANFVKRTKTVVHQFNRYAVDSLHVNGELTLGENIADLGGLTIAYEAFKKAQQGKPAVGLIEGMTPDQRFFVGWARVWRSHETPQATRSLIKTNPHSPSNFRVNGPLSNMPAFYKAYDIKPGDPMMAPDSLRAQIW
jgi:putative endopeptidase